MVVGKASIVLNNPPIKFSSVLDHFGVFSPLTYAEACEKSSCWLSKESCFSTGVRKSGNTCASSIAMI